MACSLQGSSLQVGKKTQVLISLLLGFGVGVMVLKMQAWAFQDPAINMAFAPQAHMGRSMGRSIQAHPSSIGALPRSTSGWLRGFPHLKPQPLVTFNLKPRSPYSMIFDRATSGVVTHAGLTQDGTMWRNQGQFGFIRPDEGRDSVFVLPGDCVDEDFNGTLPDLGTRVTYRIKMNPRSGKLMAANVTKVDMTAARATALEELRAALKASEESVEKSIVEWEGGETAAFESGEKDKEFSDELKQILKDSKDSLTTVLDMTKDAPTVNEVDEEMLKHIASAATALKIAPDVAYMGGILSTSSIDAMTRSFKALLEKIQSAKEYTDSESAVKWDTVPELKEAMVVRKEATPKKRIKPSLMKKMSR